jgi:nucleoid-associated protein
MIVHKSIIHMIEKEQSGNPSLHLSPSLMVIDENVTMLTEKLNDSFRKDEKVLKTEFIVAEPKAFQISARFFVSDFTNDNFMNFSVNSINRMIDLLTGNNLATGGYFVYSEYTYRNINYLGVFIVRDEEEIIFNKDENGEFEVNTTTIVNTNKLAMAVRIDLGKLGHNQTRYLHFTKKQAHLSQYFFDWIEADLADKSAEDTQKLLDLVNQLHINDFPLNPENSERYTPDEFRTKLYDNILSTGRIVRIRDISRTFWDDDDFLTNKFEELEIEISTEFQAPESTLKKLKKYEISAGKIKLVFSQNDLDSGRIWLGDENQIIIRSEDLVRKFNTI